MDNKIEITNEKDALKLFDELTKVNQNRIINSALRNSAKPIKDDIITNFKSRHQTKSGYKKIRKSVKIQKMKSKNGVKVGLKSDDSFRYRFLEYGTVANRMTREKQLNRGGITGSRFFADAVGSNKSDVENKISQAIIDSLNKLVAKYNKK